MEAQYALRSEASKWIFDSEPLGWKNFTEVDFPEFKAFGYRILLPGSLLWLAKLKLYWAILDAHWLRVAGLADLSENLSARRDCRIFRLASGELLTN